MKKIKLFAIAALMVSCFAMDAQEQDRDTSKRVLGNGTVVINTASLCQDVDGFMGPTPVEIRIKNDTIIDITPLRNEETPAYFHEAAKLLKKWIGLTPAKGIALEVDAVSGATFSSDALIENVRAGLKRAVKKDAE